MTMRRTKTGTKTKRGAFSKTAWAAERQTSSLYLHYRRTVIIRTTLVAHLKSSTNLQETANGRTWEPTDVESESSGLLLLLTGY